MFGPADSIPKPLDAIAVRTGQKRIDDTVSTRKVTNPLNWTTVYPGAGLSDRDNSKGYERWRDVYPSGSYMQVNADGAKTDMIRGNYFQYSKNGITITVDQNGDVH